MIVKVQQHAYFSSICDVRIIWGGNTTIEQIRANKLPPRSFDVTFADAIRFVQLMQTDTLHEKCPRENCGRLLQRYLFI